MSSSVFATKMPKIYAYKQEKLEGSLKKQEAIVERKKERKKGRKRVPIFQFMGICYHSKYS